MGAKDRPEVAARRERLSAWIRDRFGDSRKAFLQDAEARGFKLDPTEISNLRNGAKSFAEVKARQIEIAAGMPEGYLVRPLPPSQPQGLDLETLQIALVAVKKAIKKAKVEIDLYDTAPLIALAYRERSSLPDTPTAAQLKKFDQDIIDRLKLGVSNGEWGEGRVAGTGEESDKASQAARAANRTR